jgi:hypothetical protein
MFMGASQALYHWCVTRRRVHWKKPIGEPFFGFGVFGETISKPQGFVAGVTTMSGRRRM